MNPLNKENWKEEFKKWYTSIYPAGWKAHVVVKKIDELLAAQESQVRKSCAEIAIKKACSYDDAKSLSFRDGFDLACQAIARDIEQGNK